MMNHTLRTQGIIRLLLLATVCLAGGFLSVPRAAALPNPPQKPATRAKTAPKPATSSTPEVAPKPATTSSPEVAPKPAVKPVAPNNPPAPARASTPEITPKPPAPPVAPAAAAKPKGPSATTPRTAMAERRFDVYNLGDGVNILQSANKPKGTLSVSGGKLKYQEAGNTVFSGGREEIKEIDANSVLGYSTGTFHIILKSGQTYNFAPASLMIADGDKMLNEIKHAMP